MRIVEADIVAQSIKQRHVRIGIDRMDDVVDVESEFLRHGGRSPGSSGFSRAVEHLRGASSATVLQSLGAEPQLWNRKKHKISVLSSVVSRDNGRHVARAARIDVTPWQIWSARLCGAARRQSLPRWRLRFLRE